MKPVFFLLTTISESLNFFRDQISELNKCYDIKLISSPSHKLEEIAIREGVKYKGIEMKREISLLKDLKSFINLIIYFLKEKPSVVHCNTPKASLLGLIAAYITRVPNRIYYIHGLRYEGMSGNKRKLLIALEKTACFCANKIIAVSFGIQEKVQRDLTPKKVDVIHNGSPNGIVTEDFLNSEYDIFSIRKDLGIDGNDFVFGFVGRLVGDKGINELISAFDEINSKNSKTKLVLVGNYEDNLDPLHSSTKEVIKRNSNIIEVGFQKDVKKFLSIMNIFVSPSYREGFGLSLLEANLMGIPVIATNITGYNEIIIEGKNGFLIPKKNKAILYKKMEEVYINKNDLEKMKEFCIDNVIHKFNHKDVLSKALQYYNTIN